MGRNRRSLHYAPPDFLSRVVALFHGMRLSVERAAHVVVAGIARYEIRVRSVETHFQGRTADTADLSTTLRSGRDDKGEGGGGPLRRLLEKKTADLSTALRSGRDDKRGGRRWAAATVAGKEDRR